MRRKTRNQKYLASQRHPFVIFNIIISDRRSIYVSDNSESSTSTSGVLDPDHPRPSMEVHTRRPAKRRPTGVASLLSVIGRHHGGSVLPHPFVWAARILPRGPIPGSVARTDRLVAWFSGITTLSRRNQRARFVRRYYPATVKPKKKKTPQSEATTAFRRT